MQEAYIVAGYRTAVGKAKRGGFRFFRPDDLAIEVIQGLLNSVPVLDKNLVDDVIVGNAVPEAEQGLQVGRIIAARAIGYDVPGMTVNRYCASGLETIAIATAKIRMGMAECIIAGGTESMSMVPTAGWKTVPAYSIAKDDPDYYLSMGLTAEAVAKEYNVSRQDSPSELGQTLGDLHAWLAEESCLECFGHAQIDGRQICIEYVGVYNVYSLGQAQ